MNKCFSWKCIRERILLVLKVRNKAKAKKSWFQELVSRVGFKVWFLFLENSRNITINLKTLNRGALLMKTSLTMSVRSELTIRYFPPAIFSGRKCKFKLIFMESLLLSVISINFNVNYWNRFKLDFSFEELGSVCCPFGICCAVIICHLSIC